MPALALRRNAAPALGEQPGLAKAGLASRKICDSLALRRAQALTIT
jgi:hypothetical protein